MFKRSIIPAIVFSLIMCTLVMANSANKVITFAWNDVNAKTEGYGWKLFMRGEGEVYDYDSPVSTIMWVDGQNEFGSTEQIGIEGNENALVKKYFVCRAFNATQTSSDSNEVSCWFKVGLDVVLYFRITAGCEVPPGPQNDFLNDPDVVSLYQFEENNLLGDSIGSNVLTNIGGVSADIYMSNEGGASAFLTREDYQTLSSTDADLSSDFPFKNGTSNAQISICGWFSMSESESFQVIISKHGGPSDRSWRLAKESDGTIRFVAGVDNSPLNSSIEFQAGVMYHFGVTYDGATGDAKLRICPFNGLPVEDTATLSLANYSSADLRIGSQSNNTGFMGGNIDEIVIFKRILTSAEIDSIREKTFE